MKHSRARGRVSRLLHRVSDASAHAGAVTVVVLALVVYGVMLCVAKFSLTWETNFSAAVSAVSVVMLFLIQHTQRRHQLALQLKLDELIRTSPHADDLLVHIEGADDAELILVEESQKAIHEALRAGEQLEIVEFVKDGDL